MQQIFYLPVNKGRNNLLIRIGNVMQRYVSAPSHWKPWQMAVLILLCGLLVGVLTLVGQAVLPGSLNQIANSGAIWLVPPFFIGSLMSSERYAALAGIGTLVCTVIGFYLAQSVIGIALSPFYIILWLLVALVGGTLSGVAGHWWRYGRLPKEKRLSRSIFALAFLGGVFVTEGLYLLLLLHYLPQGIGGIIIGVLIVFILGRSFRERLFSLFFLPSIVLFAGAVYLLINWAGSLNSF
jgi:hypothetical protein